VDNARECKQCGRSLKDHRPDALFCGRRCKTRYRRRPVDSNYIEPPASGTNVRAETRADVRFRAALSAEGIRAIPLTDEERRLLDAQRRNRGVLLPALQQRMLAREYERIRLEAAEAARADPLRVQDQLDTSTYGHLARRAIQSRDRNSKPVHPDIRALRPGRSGPSWQPSAAEAEMTDAPWSRGRW
jgi:hypothetical protein